LRLRSKQYEGKIASKIANKVFSYFGCAFLKEEATITYVQTLVEQLILDQDFTAQPELELKPTTFIDRYSEKFAFLNLLDKTLFMLERGQKYIKASIALVLLLRHYQIWVDRRGHWFLRLIANLRKLKQKKLAMDVCTLAITKQGPLADQWIRANERN